MMQHLTYHRAQVHAADLTREAQRHRLASGADCKQPGQGPVIRRIVDRLARASSPRVPAAGVNGRSLDCG
jgi:hypothetical protein